MKAITFKLWLAVISCAILMTAADHKPHHHEHQEPNEQQDHQEPHKKHDHHNEHHHHHDHHEHRNHHEHHRPHVVQDQSAESEVAVSASLNNGRIVDVTRHIMDHCAKVNNVEKDDIYKSAKLVVASNEVQENQNRVECARLCMMTLMKQKPDVFGVQFEEFRRDESKEKVLGCPDFS